MPTLNDTLNKFDRTNFVMELILNQNGGSCFEYCDYESMYLELKSFIECEIKIALESVVMEKKEIESILFEEELKRKKSEYYKDIGFNTCRESLKKNIEAYLNN